MADSNNIGRWYPITNPNSGIFTNTFTNYYRGVIIRQTTDSPFHILPNLKPSGKYFTVINDVTSTFNVFVNDIQISPDDVATFFWDGANWNPVSGKAVIDYILGDGIPPSTFQGLTDTPNSYAGSENFIVRVNPTATGLDFLDGTLLVQQFGYRKKTINYNDVADSGLVGFNIGITLPTDVYVTRAKVEIITAFNDIACSQLSITASSGFSNIMNPSDTDIKTEGLYINELTGTQLSGGQFQLNFNLDPDGIDGTQGQLSAVIEFLI